MFKRTRRRFLEDSMIAAAAAVVAGSAGELFAEDTKPASAASLKAARKKAAHRKRRIIMNNDGGDRGAIKPGEPKMWENFLSKRTSPLVGSQVDTIFYCTTGVFDLYPHNSPETELAKQKGQWPWELGTDGPDTLATIIQFGHKHDMEVFWSMRMNDTHDSYLPKYFTQWKKDHPQCLMGKKGDKCPRGANRWSAVDYGVPEARDKVFRILRDVATRYDVDGLEFDFFRHPVYFKPQMTGDTVTQQHCDMMTGLLRRVRKMTEEVSAKRGRPMLIAVRVPDSVGFAKGIGLDLVAWMKEDLIDILTGGGYYHFEPWENLVALCKPHDVPVYACLSTSRIVPNYRPSILEKSTQIVPVWRDEALRAWEAGVDGIYIFNRFDPHDRIFRELGDPEILKGLERKYQYNLAGDGLNTWLKNGERFVKLPDLSK